MPTMWRRDLEADGVKFERWLRGRDARLAIGLRNARGLALLTTAARGEHERGADESRAPLEDFFVAGHPRSLPENHW